LALYRAGSTVSFSDWTVVVVGASSAGVLRAVRNLWHTVAECAWSVEIIMPMEAVPADDETEGACLRKLDSGGSSPRPGE
jgi:hypothetical protein